MSKCALQKTKITIEIEATPLPEGTLKEGEGDTNDHLFPYMVTTRLKVGDRQIGLVSRMSLTADSVSQMPLLEVSLAGGNKPLDFGLTPEVKESLSISAAALRQFPFVAVHVPTKPVV